MNSWLKNHAWTLTITTAGIISTFTVYGYRIDSLEKQVAENRSSIQTLSIQQNQINVQLAQIAVDIQYIKENVARVFKY